jgi:hypothetical protein
MSNKTSSAKTSKIPNIKQTKPSTTLTNKLSSVKSITPESAKLKLQQKMEKLKLNASLIIFSLLSVGIILFFYYNSKGYKVRQSLINMENYKLFVITGSELNKQENRDKKLCDFYVSCAYKPYMVSNQLFGYCSLEIMKAILFSGVRCVYVDIFNSSMTSDADPVISNGYMEGEWKLAFNSISFKDMCKLIKKIVFSPGYVNNYNDPFILCLNLKTNGNYKCLNKVKKILFQTFGSYLLDNTYTYSSKNIMTEPINNLMGKMIIFSSAGYENSDLEELINFSWDKSGLKKITFESLDLENDNTSVVKLDNSELKNFNMNGITLVTPNENTIYTYNYNPSYAWDSGSQFVFLNFQKIDKNMNTYIDKFQTLSFIKKPNNMISGSKQTEIKLKINKEIKNKSSLVYEPLNCPEKPSENYDALLGDEMLFYKNKRSDGLGLCYNVNVDESCNCNSNLDPDCDDTLWSENTVTINGDTNMKLCCSTRRINDPSISCSRLTASSGEQQCTPKKYFYSNNCRKPEDQPPVDIVDVKMQGGQSNFDRYTGGGDFTNIFERCEIDDTSDLKDKKVCLMHLSNSQKDLCPVGWKYNGKLDTEKYDNKNINICCRNL